jgi:hypothetical protein
VKRRVRVAVQPADDFAGDFSEGLCAVFIGGNYGYIDKTGAVVLPPQFGTAEPFIGGLARVRIGNTFGYIDRSGKFIWQGAR